MSLAAAFYTGFGAALALYVLTQPLLSVSIWWRRRSLAVDALAAAAPTETVLLQRFQTALIIGWALTEVIAILGMASAMISRDATIALLLGGPAVLLQIVVHRPPLDALHEALRRHRLGVR